MKSTGFWVHSYGNPFLKIMRIATWNVQRPKAKGWKRNPITIETINSINADIWILTETQESIQPNSLAYSKTTTYYAEQESCATIWSRYPIISQRPTCDPFFTICLELETPLGNCLVYGTIITYAHDGTQSGAKLWEKHYEAIEAQAQDWKMLAQEGLPLILAGDFNETLHPPHNYGTKRGRTALLQALEDGQLQAVTAREPIGRAIDHICMSRHWQERLQPLDSKNQFQGYKEDGKAVSDHQGLFIDLQ
jgi:endonuclease/exonuclease/phosphatase family metal-dependent hydrolase